jgi:hypothetical protein
MTKQDRTDLGFLTLIRYTQDSFSTTSSVHLPHPAQLNSASPKRPKVMGETSGISTTSQLPPHTQTEQHRQSQNKTQRKKEETHGSLSKPAHLIIMIIPAQEPGPNKTEQNRTHAEKRPTSIRIKSSKQATGSTRQQQSNQRKPDKDRPSHNLRS